MTALLQRPAVRASPSAALELAEVVRRHGHRLDLDGEQARILRAIATCRTAALGGHVQTCDHCQHQQIAYNSCRNRHCPKCRAAAGAEWLSARAADLLPVPYYHVVFTLPRCLAALALQNKRLLYEMLFAAGINFNNVWAARGVPVDVTKTQARWNEPTDFHIVGSDASGVVCAVGSEVTNVKVGDRVVVHAGQWDLDDPWLIGGGDPGLAPSFRVWGYDSCWGSFSQFCSTLIFTASMSRANWQRRSPLAARISSMALSTR